MKYLPLIHRFLIAWMIGLPASLMAQTTYIHTSNFASAGGGLLSSGSYSAATFHPFDAGIARQSSTSYQHTGGSATKLLNAMGLFNVEAPPEINDPPSAQTDVFTTNEAESLLFNDRQLLANDTDPERDTLSVISVQVTSQTQGTLTDNGNNSYTYNPNRQFDQLGEADTASDFLAYTIADGNGGTAGGVIVITIQGLRNNTPPIARDDVFTTNEAESLLLTDGQLLANDTDPDGDVLRVTSVQVTGLTQGTLTDNGNSSYTYDPNGQFDQLGGGDTASDFLGYTITDGNGGTAAGAIVITIQGLRDNTAPIARDDVFATTEDVLLTLTPTELLANDSDIDAADTLTLVSINRNETRGNLTQADDGTLTYSPLGSFGVLGDGDTVEDRFGYTISDGNDGLASAFVTIRIAGVNDAPSAQPDNFTLSEDEILSIASTELLANDEDPNVQDQLSIVSLITGDTRGTVILLSDDSVEYDGRSVFNSLSFGESVSDVFRYVLQDNHQAESETEVTLNITGVNDPPVTAQDEFQTGANRSLIIQAVTLLGNDTDPDRLDTLTISGFDDSQTLGLVSESENGDIIYDPNGQFARLGVGERATDQFTYFVSDGRADPVAGQVTIVITGSNSDPTAFDDTVTTPANTLIIIPFGDLLSNDTDPNASDILTITAVTASQAGAKTSRSFNRTVSYDPRKLFESLAVGETVEDRFTYTLSDGNGGASVATVTVLVTGVNAPPSASDDFFNVTEETDLDVLENDTDIDGDTLFIESLNAGGVQGGLQISEDKKVLHYLPPAGFNGVESFTYSISDGNGGSSTSRVFLLVDTDEINDAPRITIAKQVEGLEDQELILPLRIEDDQLPLAELRIQLESGNPELIAAEGLSLVDTDDGLVLRIRPRPDAHGQGEVRLTVGDGIQEAKAAVTVTILPVADPPVIEPIEDRFVDWNENFSVELMLADVDTPVDQITLSISTNSPELIDDESVVFSGEGPLRLLEFSPTSMRRGIVEILVRAEDPEGNTTETRFQVSVQDFSRPIPVMSLRPKAAEIGQPPELILSWVGAFIVEVADSRLGPYTPLLQVQSPINIDLTGLRQFFRIIPLPESN